MTTDRKKLVDMARRLLATRADAEDAVQDTYMRAFDTFSDWQPPDAAWMYTVLRNIAIDRRRRLKVQTRHAEAELPADIQMGDPMLEIRSECEAALRQLLGRLSITEATALLLRDVFELEYGEISSALNRSESATRQVLHRARSRVRRTDAHFDADERYLRLCCRALETREPALLIDVLRGGVRADANAGLECARPDNGSRSSSMLVQVNGRYAIALVLGKTVLCVVPVGVQALGSGETV